MNSKSLVSLFLIFFELSSLNNLHSQEKYQIKRFTSDNGLPYNFIHSITQDKPGFLWIATWDGLSRFDGYEFKNYYHNPDDSTSIPFFAIDKVLVDRLNNLWVFTRGHFPVRYDRANDCFRPINFSSRLVSKPNDITIGKDQNVWIAADTALYRYNIESGQLKSFEIKCDNDSELLSARSGTQVTFDNKGDLWIYSFVNYDYLIYKGDLINDSTVMFHRVGNIPIDNYKSSLVHNELGNFNIYISGTGKVWLYGKYGLFYFDDNQKNFIKNENTIDPGQFKGNPYFVWSDDKSGINIIDSQKGSLINLIQENEDYIESVFIDNSGIIWSGNVNASREEIGLNRYSRIPDYFKHYLTEKNEDKSANIVFPILKDSHGDLWVGTRLGDYLFRIKSSGDQEKMVFMAAPLSKSRPKIRSLTQDSGGIWIGTTDGQLIYHDFLSKKFQIRLPYQNGDESFSVEVHNILKGDSDLTINAIKGVYRFIPESNSLKLYYQHVPEGSGFSIVKDGWKGFWLGTYGNRVIHLDSGLNVTTEFKIGTEGNIVEHICPGDSGDIWVALMGGGLGHLYPESGKQEIFTTADGLSNNVTYSILKDFKGYLWISTNQGLSRFNPQTRHFSNFGKTEGLMITEFNSDSYYQTPDGEMFFGGIGGLVGFHPDSIDKYRSNLLKSPLVLTDFRVSGIARHFKKPLNETDTLRLRKGDNNFQVTFACLDFLNSEKIRYRYRIANQSEEWIETDSRNRKVSFANLTHNDYKLEIEATDGNGEWVNKTSFLVIIPHRLTEFLWVRISLILILISGFIVAGFIYMRQVRLKDKHINDQLRLETLRGQMNPHFIFNSLNSINYFISKEDKLSANHYIADFSRLIRSILSNLSSNYVPFEKEILSLHDYMKLEHLRFGDKFNYSINTDKIEGKSEISVFPGMIQPFIENAIWHGVRGLESRLGFISIDFIPVSPAKIQCIVEDDGIGRNQANIYRNELPGHKPRGIDIVRERIQIFNNLTKNDYKVTIEDLFEEREETGTRVIIDLPVKGNYEEKKT